MPDQTATRPADHHKPAAVADGCLLCGSHEGAVLWREGGFEARQCPCGMLYTTPPPPSADPTIDLHLQSFYALPAAMKAAWVRRRRPLGTLLEVGCGEGHFLNAARAEGYEVCAIEAHPGRAEHMRRTLGVEVETALVETSTWPEQSCDLVYHCDMLSHFPNPRQALRRMKALLRPGGALCFEVGLVADLHPVWYRLMGTVHMPAHRWFYTEQSLAALLASTGLRIEHISRFGLAPSFLVARLGRLIGFGGGATRSIEAPRRENALRAALHNFVRYRIGALFPRMGPQTVLVIATPEACDAA